MTPSEAERRYFELKGRLVSGKLEEAEFRAGVRDLLAHDAAGRAWTIDPADGSWLVHDGQRWTPRLDGPGPDPPSRPEPARRFGPKRLLIALATVLILLLAADRSWQGRPPDAGPAPAEPPASAVGPGPAEPAPEYALSSSAASASGAFPSSTEVEQAGEQVQRLLAAYAAAPDFEAARAATRSFFVEASDQRPAYVGQLFELPASRRLRPTGAYRIVQQVGSGPDQASVLAEATYAGASASESRLGWAFVLTRTTAGWRVSSVQLNTAK